MNHFSHALDSILEHAKKRGLTAAKLAESAGCSPSDISRLRKGHADPTHYIKTLATSPLLERTEATRLIIAYLRGAVPADFQPDISITAAAPTSILLESDLAPWERAIEFLRRRSHEDPSFADWIVNLVQMLQGQIPSASAQDSASA